MGLCIYCGKDAGFLRRKHRECKSKRESARKQIIELADSAITAGNAIGGLEQQVRSLGGTNFLTSEEIGSALVSGWQHAVDNLLGNGVINPEAEKHLIEFQRVFGLPEDRLDSNGAFTRVVKGAILRDVMNGQMPDRIKIQGQHPFNLQKSESVIWLFSAVKYFEERTHREYRGGSQGMSIRIAKGVYYRFGSFRGYPVDTQQTMHVDTGMLGITNKHVYFSGPHKSFRIKIDKIVSIRPYEDGVGISKDGANPKPQLFITGDGWFTYNLLHNLNQLAE